MPKVRRARKSLREPLTLARITAAAFELVDAEGAAALSMRRLAERLDCQAMSLYHHVASIETLLDGLVDELLGRCRLPTEAPASRETLLQTAQDFLALAQVHPRVFQMVVGRPWTGSKALSLAMVLVRQFGDLGLQPRAALAAARVLGAYLNGAGMALAGWRLQAARADAGVHQDQPDAAWLRAQSHVGAVQADISEGLQKLLDCLLLPQGGSTS